jgi:hypothetical protein
MSMLARHAECGSKPARELDRQAVRAGRALCPRSAAQLKAAATRADRRMHAGDGAPPNGGDGYAGSGATPLSLLCAGFVCFVPDSACRTGKPF